MFNLLIFLVEKKLNLALCRSLLDVLQALIFCISVIDLGAVQRLSLFWSTIHDKSMTLRGVGPTASSDASCWNFSILAGGT